MIEKPKITLVYNNGHGTISTCSIESTDLVTVHAIYDNFDTLIKGIGFEPPKED